MLLSNIYLSDGKPVKTNNLWTYKYTGGDTIVSITAKPLATRSVDTIGIFTIKYTRLYQLYTFKNPFIRFLFTPIKYGGIELRPSSSAARLNFRERCYCLCLANQKHNLLFEPDVLFENCYALCTLKTTCSRS